MTMTHMPHADGVERSYLAATKFQGLVFPCGQIPVAQDGTIPSAIGEQTVLCLNNLEASLVRAGSSLSRILQITVYLAKMQEFEEYDAAWRERFSGHPLPPRTTLFVAGFRGDKRIELTAIAAEGTRGE